MPRFVWFFIAAAGLVLGYLLYSKYVEKVFGPQPHRPTPAEVHSDGVDYVPMPKWKLCLIQLLNIAGVGPVFGPIMGALYGPAALLWIVLGSVFAGAVHDYFSGMLSVRYGGANVPDIVGYNLGKAARQLMRIFAVLLLLLVGVVFVTAPAGLLARFSPEWLDFKVWLGVIFLYYFLAAIMPIDKIIGRIYPFFGIFLLIMAAGMAVTLFMDDSGRFYHWAEWGSNLHPGELPVWPLLFITIACGALSGFHATQSPLMARCMANEREGRFVFYGSMIAEGFIALVWATVGMTFYDSPAALNASISAGTASNVVYETSYALMGTFGGVLAIIGVIVLPITSGDTAFRAARLTIAETIRLSQVSIPSRLIIALPLFAIGIVLSQLDFYVIWRYFGWSNQTLAAVMLWAAAAYLLRRKKVHWICTLPALFITAVTLTYICYEPDMGLNLPIAAASGIGIGGSALCLAVFLIMGRKAVNGAPDNV